MKPTLGRKIWNEKNCVFLCDERYEKLFNHPKGEKWRVFSGDDDYDYIVDPLMITLLDSHFRLLKLEGAA